MFIDSVIVYGLVKELKEQLLSSQVKQIHQTDARVLDIELYRPMASPAHLILCVQNPPYLYASCGEKKKQQYIDSQTFCMTLRKHLEGSRLSDIRQIQMDRIVCLSFDRIETGGEIVTKDLYAELIPSAPNLILTENGRILDVLIRSRRQHRELANQKEYALPEGGDRLDFMQFSPTELRDILRYGDRDTGTLRDLLFARFNGLLFRMTTFSARAKHSPSSAKRSALPPASICIPQRKRRPFRSFPCHCRRDVISRRSRNGLLSSPDKMEI